MKEVLKFNGDGGFERFTQTKEYFVGYSFKTLIAQGIVDFALAQVELAQATPIDHRILNASTKGTLTLGEIERYTRIRNIKVVGYVLNYQGNLKAIYI